MAKEVEELIEEMMAVKAAHPTLELQEILRIFNIAALKSLTNTITRGINIR